MARISETKRLAKLIDAAHHALDEVSMSPLLNGRDSDIHMLADMMKRLRLLKGRHGGYAVTPPRISDVDAFIADNHAKLRDTPPPPVKKIKVMPLPTEIQRRMRVATSKEMK